MKQERYALWATDEITKELLDELERVKKDNIEYLLGMDLYGEELVKEYHRLRGTVEVLDDVIDTIKEKGKVVKRE